MENNDDVIQLVNDAIANNEIICVRGAAHSFPLIGKLEQAKKSLATGKNYKFLMLSYMDTVHIENNIVTVEAGCHLGPDPWALPKESDQKKLEKSLLYQLDQQKLAIADLGGITHQTVGGFLSTASSGGSTQFSFEEALLSIDIVTCENGKATLKTFTKPDDGNLDDPFYGAGAATMGLFGVIVSAKFKCIPQFYIKGQEAITTVDNCAIALFESGKSSSGKPDLQTFLENTQYTRLLWWPQQNVNKMVVWQAQQTDQEGAYNFAADALELMYGKDKEPKFIRPLNALKPYQDVPLIFGSPTPAEMGADLLFTAIGRWPNWLSDLMGTDTDEYKKITGLVDTFFFPYIFPKLLDVFVATDKPDNANKGPQQFADVWYTGIPMDNGMSDKLFPIWFTELWIDISKTQEVMKDLLNFYNEGFQNTGAFCCEIYAARHSSFWLSPSYSPYSPVEKEMVNRIRIDVFWFANNTGGPEKFYQQFWDLLSKYNYRPHWGKYLPDTVKLTDSSVNPPVVTYQPGPTYLKNNYPKWDKWVALQKQLDPHQVFVNDYWRQHLGITDE